MSKPYAQLRAQMSPAAQAMAAAQADALLAALPSPAPGGFEAAHAQWQADEARIREGQQRLLVWIVQHAPPPDVG